MAGPRIGIDMGIIRREGRLQAFRLAARGQQAVNQKLPNSLKGNVISFERLQVIGASNRELLNNITAQIEEGVAYLALEQEGKVSLLKVEDIQSLDTAALDEAGIVAQIDA